MNQFHKIHVIERNSSEGFQKVGREKRKLTRIQTTSRPNHIWPEALTRIGTAAQRTGNRCSKMTGAEVKQNSFVMILQGKDGILCSIAIWYTNSFKWKDLEESSSLNFLFFFFGESWRMLSRLATWRICGDKIPRVTPQPWKYEILSSVNLGRKKFELRMLICSAHLGCTHECRWVYTQTKHGYWETDSHEWCGQFWRSVFQRRMPRETEKHNEISFQPKHFWFQMKRRHWKRNERRTRNERRSYSGTQKQQQGKSTLLHWWTSIDSEVYVHSLGEFERTIIIPHVLHK